MSILSRITHFFHALTFARSRGSCSNIRPLRPCDQTFSEGPGKCWCTETNLYDSYSCILFDSLKSPIEEAWKIMKLPLWVHWTLQLMAFCFLFFLTSFREECNDVDVNKNQDKMPIPGQPCIVVWRKIKRSMFLSKNHVQTARESADLNMDLVGWKQLLSFDNDKTAVRMDFV